MPEGCSLRSRGSWLGGSLVSALSFVASAPSEVAHCEFVLVVWLFSMGLRQHGTQVVICMSRDDTKLSPLALQIFFSPINWNPSRHGFAVVFLFVFCVGCFGCLFWFLFLVLFLLLGFLFVSVRVPKRDKGIGLCTGPLPVYFCGLYSFGLCMNSIINLICNML